MFFFKIIESFFKSKNLTSFLYEERDAEKAIQNGEENDAAGVQIEVKKRRELVRHLVDFMIKSFGTKPSAHQKISTAKAAIMVFPRLAFKDSIIGGIVSVEFSFCFDANH